MNVDQTLSFYCLSSLLFLVPFFLSNPVFLFSQLASLWCPFIKPIWSIWVSSIIPTISSLWSSCFQLGLLLPQFFGFCWMGFSQVSFFCWVFVPKFTWGFLYFLPFYLDFICYLVDVCWVGCLVDLCSV